MSTYYQLKDAVEKLYFAAYWSPDRNCNAKRLWEAVRDAAEIEHGQTKERLGHDRRNPEFEFGTLIMIDKPAYVVDKNGIGWWVDPIYKEIKRAS